MQLVRKLVLAAGVVWVAACFKAEWDTAAAEFGDSRATACQQLVPGGLCTQLPGGLLETQVASLCHKFRETCATPRVVTLTKHTFKSVVGNVLAGVPTHLLLVVAALALVVYLVVVVCKGGWCRTRHTAPEALVLADVDTEMEEAMPACAFKGVPWTPKQD